MGIKSYWSFLFVQPDFKGKGKKSKSFWGFIDKNSVVDFFAEPLYLLLIQINCMHYKKGFLLPVLFFLVMTANGQFKKGMRMAGASLGSVFFNSGNSDISFPAPTTGYSSKTTSFGLNLSPSMGWFMSGHTAIGVSLSVNSTSNKNTFEAGGNTFQQDKSNNFNFGAGGFARNYFGSSSTFMPFGQFSLNLGINTSNSSGFFYGGSGATAYKTTYDGKSSGGFFINTTLVSGLTKLLSPHTGLDFYAGYTFSYIKNTFKTTTKRDDGNNGSIDLTSVGEPTTKYTNHGFMLGVGFQVFLDARK